MHAEEYPNFILALIIFDVLNPISNNQLEFQLVSHRHEIVGHCFDLLATLVTKSRTTSRSRNKEITDLIFKISLFIPIHA